MAALVRLFCLAWFIFIGNAGIDPLASASGPIFNRSHLHLLWVEFDDLMAVIPQPGNEANSLVHHWQYNLSCHPEIPQDSGYLKKVHLYLVIRSISSNHFDIVTGVIKWFKSTQVVAQFPRVNITAIGAI
jgi:hypothetical protein